MKYNSVRFRQIFINYCAEEVDFKVGKLWNSSKIKANQPFQSLNTGPGFPLLSVSIVCFRHEVPSVEITPNKA